MMSDVHAASGSDLIEEHPKYFIELFVIDSKWRDCRWCELFKTSENTRRLYSCFVDLSDPHQSCGNLIQLLKLNNVKSNELEVEFVPCEWGLHINDLRKTMNYFRSGATRVIEGADNFPSIAFHIWGIQFPLIISGINAEQEDIIPFISYVINSFISSGTLPDVDYEKYHHDKVNDKAYFREPAENRVERRIEESKIELKNNPSQLNPEAKEEIGYKDVPLEDLLNALDGAIKRNNPEETAIAYKNLGVHFIQKEKNIPRGMEYLNLCRKIMKKYKLKKTILYEKLMETINRLKRDLSEQGEF